MQEKKLHVKNLQSKLIRCKLDRGTDLFELSRDVHVFVLGEEVHVTEAVNRNEWKIFLGLTQVVERVGEFHAVSDQEIHIF